VDLNLLLQEVADTLQHMSNTHTIVIHGTAPSYLIGDKGRLEQVFINLLSNAIKYAPDASLIEVEVSNSAETVTIKVRDHGIGIPQEQREKIFERFYRAPDLSQRAVPGLGMGLYIVAEIVKRQGGNITVDSEVGKGSTFSVTFVPRSNSWPKWSPI
jgi:signal transduction histidine kinase